MHNSITLQINIIVHIPDASYKGTSAILYITITFRDKCIESILEKKFIMVLDY